MPFPSYVPTVQVSAGGALVLESADQLELDVTFQASRGLTWQGTGMQFPNLGASADRSTAGGEVTWTLPATNVAGWLDLKSRSPIDVDGGERHTHSYTATIRILRGGKQAGAPVKIGPFVLPEGSGPVDLDTLVGAEGVQGQLISIPDQWSALVAQAQAAADGAAESAAAAEAAMVDSAAFVGEQIGTPGTPAGVALAQQLSGVDVDLSEGDVTLAVAPLRVRLTGAVGARTLTLPMSAGALFVDNDTGFDITLARTGSASTTVVLAGATVRLAGGLK